MRLSTRWTVIGFLSLLLGIAGGFLAGKHNGFDNAASRRRELPNGAILCKPGPWGDLSYTPFTIAAPDDLLPVSAIEANGTHWIFQGFTASTLATLLQSTSLTADQQRALLDPSILHPLADGVELTPTPDMVLSLPDDARAALYQTLAQIPENASDFQFIAQDTLDARFADSGVSPDTLALFKHLACPRGNYLIFSGLPALLSRLTDASEKVRFLKALTSQRTMMLRLHVTPYTDVQALTQYWGKGDAATDVQTILQSLTTVSNGSWISILMVLPPLPTGELYDYPGPIDTTLPVSPILRDANWTTFNFFHEVPDPNFARPEPVQQELRDNYFPATGDPRYGDVILFSKPDGTIIHSAVYIADDLCFTKNGSTAFDPWMLESIADLTDRFSCELPPDQQVTVSYFRSKEL